MCLQSRHRSPKQPGTMGLNASQQPIVLLRLKGSYVATMYHSSGYYRVTLSFLCSVNLQKGRTPLHLACVGEHVEVAKCVAVYDPSSLHGIDKVTTEA